MNQTRSETQAKSDEKRGVKVKGFKLKLEDIALIEEVAKRHNLSQNDLIIQAVKFFAESHSK